MKRGKHNFKGRFGEWWYAYNGLYNTYYAGKYWNIYALCELAFKAGYRAGKRAKGKGK